MIKRRSVLKGLCATGAYALAGGSAIARPAAKVRVTLVRWPFT